MKNRRAIGEFDQGELKVFAIGYWGFERKCSPGNSNAGQVNLDLCG
jgi:hypothetical protein